MGNLESLLSLATQYTVQSAENRLFLLTRMRISLKTLVRSWQHPVPDNALPQRVAHFNTVFKILYESPLLVSAEILEDMERLAIELEAQGQTTLEVEKSLAPSPELAEAPDETIKRCLADVESKLTRSMRWLPRYRFISVMLALALLLAASFAAGFFSGNKLQGLF